MEILIMVRPAPIRAPALMALVFLVGLAGAATCWRARSAAKRCEVCLDGWDIHYLAGHLEGRGLRLHLSPTFAGGDWPRFLLTLLRALSAACFCL
jgi:hypothetical protein